MCATKYLTHDKFEILKKKIFDIKLFCAYNQKLLKIYLYINIFIDNKYIIDKYVQGLSLSNIILYYFIYKRHETIKNILV